MPTNYAGRVTLILVVLWAALSLIFPSVPPSMFWFFKMNQPVSLHPNLRPGIDMVGGTSLLYEIKAAPGSSTSGDANLAERVMEALKKRVDPQGVRNLIWRPQGNRLEIQMPLSGRSGDSKAKREEYHKAEGAVDATNVRLNQVTGAIENSQGAEREKRLDELAMGSPSRRALLTQLAQTYDQIQAAREQKNAAQQADKEDEYERLKQQLAATNVPLQELEGALELPQPKRDQRLTELRKRAEDLPARQKAIDEFASAYTEYQKVKNELDDSGDLKRLLKGSGVLEFHIVVDDLTSPEAQAMRDRLQHYGPRVQANDTMKWVYTERPAEFHNRAVPYGDKFYVLVYTTPDREMVNGQGFNKWALEEAAPDRDQFGASQVRFQFDTQGASYFSELTRINKGKPLGIVLDDRLISAPNINDVIGRTGVITAGGGQGFAPDELNYLVSTLSAGSLPAQLADEPISERTVGPQLGADNLRRGFMACIWGLVVVAVFLIVYYYRAGVVALIAVLMNLVLILGVMAMLNATFTLPGIAGIVLTIGAAVDANVLIFERLREEQQRGLSLRMAVRNAYDRAFSAILDSNMTTVITSLVLVWMGSEEVRGFGVTLLIGLISSLFTALFVTKTILGIMIDRFGVTDLGSLPLTFPKWDRMLRPDIDWMGKIWVFVAFSVIFCALGLTAFGYYYKKGEMLDIEFASGTSVEFSLKQPTNIETVRSMIETYEHEAITSPQRATGADGKPEDPLPSAGVVSVGTDERTYEVVTPNADSATVRRAVLAIFGNKLNIEAESHFANDAAKVDDAIAAGTIVPITADTQSVAGFTPRNLGTYRGGAAIILKNLNPPLSPEEIKIRIGRQRLQAQSGQAAQSYRDFTVESDAGPNTPTSTAVVLTGDPNIQYQEDQGKWREDVVAPVWRLVNDALTKPAELQGVKNFNPSVAADTMKDAIMALVLSVLIILAYIWLRFGNLIYGTATVVAMLHDTILVLAAIGVAHLLVHTVPRFADLLLVEPFRLNLTIVASILTVMSYSMIDTIVVFDRVRENRGKYGHLDRKVINDSINQTLSRTLLTGGTNVVTVFVMYVMGGSGIHGFTFVLLFGIIVGTYSSIAIAAPFLLLHHEKAAATVRSRPVGQLQRA